MHSIIKKKNCILYYVELLFDIVVLHKFFIFNNISEECRKKRERA